jgi:hypothetical protein
MTATLNDQQKFDRPATQHVVKCWPAQFSALCSGEKTFEYRKNDRDYRAGDTLVVQEWDPGFQRFTGRSASFHVPYVLEDGFGLPDGYCVLSVKAAPSQHAGAEAPVGYVSAGWLQHPVGTATLYTEPRPRLATSPVFAAPSQHAAVDEAAALSIAVVKLLSEVGYSSESSVIDSVRDLIRRASDALPKQQPLGEPFQTVLDQNLWGLYASDAQACTHDYVRTDGICTECGISDAPATAAHAGATLGMDRSQFHDKAWALWQEKALDSALLPKLSIHAIRMLWDVLYDSMPKERCVDAHTARHVNDDTLSDAACDAALAKIDARTGQGVDPFWAWGFRKGWEARRAPTPAATAPAALTDYHIKRMAADFWKVQNVMGVDSYMFDAVGFAHALLATNPSNSADSTGMSK